MATNHNDMAVSSQNGVCPLIHQGPSINWMTVHTNTNLTHDSKKRFHLSLRVCACVVVHGLQLHPKIRIFIARPESVCILMVMVSSLLGTLWVHYKLL